MPPSHLQVQPILSLETGRPVSFLSGPLSNRVFRVQLDELQKANLGRKCGVKDRRPLDPPPVVRLRLFEIINSGTAQESEREWLDLSEPISLGFICFVDLFPFPNSSSADQASEGGASDPFPSASSPPSSSGYSQYGDESLSTSFAGSLLDAPLLQNLASVSSALDTHMPVEILEPAGLTPLLQPYVPPHVAQNIPPSPGPYLPTRALTAQVHEEPSPNQIVAYVEGAPIVQHMCCTRALVGTTFVSMSCFNLDGSPVLLGVFPDLAVNATGTFLLRYLVVNILNATNATDEHARRPVLAECWGGPVVIYSANLFPGLQESTDLTKTLSKLGVPVNIRQTERKKRKKDDQPERAQRRLESAPVTGPGLSRP